MDIEWFERTWKEEVDAQVSNKVLELVSGLDVTNGAAAFGLAKALNKLHYDGTDDGHGVVRRIEQASEMSDDVLRLVNTAVVGNAKAQFGDEKESEVE